MITLKKINDNIDLHGKLKIGKYYEQKKRYFIVLKFEYNGVT